ncbi:MAG: hypothetical protein H0X30_36145 [Anaerolineae bacterium]|nr:hypothetical protein [Anaerolineae bacterium]
MKRTLLLGVAALALLISLVAAAATTASETPNNPQTNPDANACYTGGSMVGKCKLDGELWKAGWYEIRLEYGLISRDQVPDQYKWLLNEPATTQEPLQPTPTKLPG